MFNGQPSIDVDHLEHQPRVKLPEPRLPRITQYQPCNLDRDGGRVWSNGEGTDNIYFTNLLNHNQDIISLGSGISSIHLCPRSNASSEFDPVRVKLPPTTMSTTYSRRFQETFGTSISAAELNGVDVSKGCYVSCSNSLSSGQTGQRKSTNSSDNELCVSHTIDSCDLKLGLGYQVLDLSTEPELCKSLVLGNLPLQFSKTRILALIHNFGEPEHIETRATSQHCHAFVRFKSSSSATQAVHELNDREVDGSRIFACLQYSSHHGPSNHYNMSLKVFWKAPSQCAYVRYGTFEEACNILSKLDESLIFGRRLKVTHHLNNQTMSGFSLRVEGLSPLVSMADVINILGSQHVSLYHHNYTSLEASLGDVRNLLEEKAPLDCFELLETFSPSQNVCVKATYFRPVDAIEARARLHGRRLSQLGNSSLLVHYNQMLHYRIPNNIFEAVKKSLTKLKAEFESSRFPVSLRWRLSKESHDTKCVFLEGEDLTTVSKVKLELESILGGEIILSRDGNPVWHHFFAQPSGLQFLAECGSPNQAIIESDAKRCILRFYGSKFALQEVRQRIEGKLKEVERETRILALRSRSLPYMLREGGLARLQKRFGANVVRMDLLRKLLIVHGNPEAARAARLEINNAIHLYHGNMHSGSSNLCPVCGDTVDKPVALACGHCFCKECLRHYLLSARDACAFPLHCLADSGRCQLLLPIHIIQTILTAEENLILVRAAFSSYVMIHAKEFRYCPTPNCTKLYRPSQNGDPEPLQCSSCLKFICTYCHTEHLGISCRDWRDQHDATFRLWRSEHGVKSCPNCGVNIERMEGCNHLTCICGTHLCWQCLKTFVDGQRVYEHMFRVHGGIGLS